MENDKKALVASIGLALTASPALASNVLQPVEERPFVTMWADKVTQDVAKSAGAIYSEDVKGKTNIIVAENFESTSSSASGANEGADTTIG